MSKKADAPKTDAKAATKAPATETAVPASANIMDDLSKKQSFKKFSWKGKDINQLLAMKMPEFA
jgi:hypothetical protein